MDAQQIKAPSSKKMPGDMSAEGIKDAASLPQNETLALGGEIPVLAVFGGIGMTKRPVKDLRDLYTLHKEHLTDFLEHCSQTLRSCALDEADGAPNSVQQNLMGWISESEEPSRRRPAAHALSFSVSAAVTTISQMARYVVICKLLGKTPGEFTRSFSAFAGHSMGMLVATCMAAVDSWPLMYQAATGIIEGTYFGARKTSATWNQGPPIEKSIVNEFVRRGEGTPSPMLSVTNFEHSKLTKEIDAVNQTLLPERKIHIALINDADSVVAAGGTEGLVALCDRLRGPVSSNVDESRIIFNKRQPRCYLQFIPCDYPAHSPHLQTARPVVREKLKHLIFRRDQVLVPVWGLEDLLEEDTTLVDNIGPAIGELILTRPVDWPKTMENMSGSWQVLDFGPGGFNGIGMLIQKMRAGSGSKAYAVCPADNLARRQPEDPVELLAVISADTNPQRYLHANFDVGPVSTKRRIDAKVGAAAAMTTTRLMDVLGLPRILVAGMTPTTCNVEIVAAIMNAGFYVEFATGGYYDAPSLAAALRKLAKAIPPDRLINVNVVYANPRGLSWQIPQLASLIREGCPIGGLTIGAGVPSLQVASEYIETLELSYIAFKPASVSAIYRVLEMAKAHATLPVLLQWTGGRGGGHHSYEDFHQPILETYHAIRQMKNVILVAGSGFGDVEDSWPYLSGEWSQKFGHHPMPYDAILLGTCIMTVLEAKTSLDAKKAMVQAAGVSDEQWPATLDGPAGGVISITSHLGEPMHVVATRGMQFWAELDKTLFNKPKGKMLEMLHSRREYIIDRLNADYEKVWFGFDYALEKPVDLADMTYFDVLRRFVELTYLDSTARWIDPAYNRIFKDFLVRTLERLDDVSQTSIVNMLPFPEQLDVIAEKLPNSTRHFLSLEDTHFFVELCRLPGQKPVPFIPVLDTNFQTWFKKDPLWQSENLDLTHHHDVGRVCILSGPVAIQHCKDYNVPVGTFLRRINQEHLRREARLNTSTTTYSPTTSFNEEIELIHAIGASHIILEEDTIRTADEIPEDLDNEQWLALLGSRLGLWGGRFFGMKKLLSNGRAYSNQIRRVFSARPGVSVRFFGKTDMSHYFGVEICSSAAQLIGPDARVSIEGNTITATIFNRYTKNGQIRELNLEFKCDQSRPFAPITEVMNGRTERITDFYRYTLFGPTTPDRLSKPPSMTHPPVVISQDEVLAWMAAVDGQGIDSSYSLGPAGEVPIEYAVILVCPRTWRHLLTWHGDVSRLLHAHTTVQLKEGHRMLTVGDEVIMTSRIVAFQNRESGVEVEMNVGWERDGQVFLNIIYKYFLLGQRMEGSLCFERGEPTFWKMHLHTEADVQALLVKQWFRPVTASGGLHVGQILTFELRRETSQKNGSLEAITSGEIWLQNPERPDGDDRRHLCARVEQIVCSNDTDSVADFMSRQAVRFGVPVRLPTEKNFRTNTGQAFKIHTPDNSMEYAEVALDHNPIHINSAFARFAGFQAPIYHGNHTSSLVLQLLRREVASRSEVMLHKYSCNFSAVVFPGDVLSLEIKHIAMDKGRAVLSIAARNESSEELVLAGEVTLGRPSSAFLFTGQGSQFAGMGLDMINQSRPSRTIWTEADDYFERQWGFALSHIVRDNPKRLTVNFCGRQGAQVRQNYLDVQEMLGSCSSTSELKLFDGLCAGSRFYVFHHEDGLLSMTQFAQPAIFVVEKAAFEHLKQLDRVPPSCCFTGHSLGEFAAIGCMTSVMSLKAALKTVFIRGALMQAAVRRNATGRSEFAMVAVDPSRVGKDCQEHHILSLVNEIARSTDLLLEVVNFNVQGHQYVCAGDKRSLDILRRVTDEVQENPAWLATPESTQKLVARYTTSMTVSAYDITLVRGKATVPLKGIDVPFHSSMLAPLRETFRRTLIEGIDKQEVSTEVLVGKWIPNVTGKPFAIDNAYIQLVARLTGSERLVALATECC